MSIDGTGDIQIQTGLLSPLTAPVAVLLAPLVQSSASLWLRHKTTRRAVYDQAWREAEEQGAFDMLFFNERGELTEGGRSNVLVKLDGRWYTPPLSAGALPGVMRAELMSDPDWLLAERSITRSELLGAAQIAVCNALRGVLMATLIT